MASWADDVAVPEREPRGVLPFTVADADRSLSASRSGTAVRHAMPDHQGLGPAWQRRLDDRDPLADRLADERRADEGWRAVPMLEDGYW